MVNLGLRLKKLISGFNEAFGTLLFLEFTICYFAIPFNVFFSSGLFELFRSASKVRVSRSERPVPDRSYLVILEASFQLNDTITLMASGNLLCLFGCLFRMVGLSRAGQRLENRVKNLTGAIEEICLQNGITNSAVVKITEQLNSVVPLRPLGIFNLNYSSLVSGQIVGLTFAVILLQFKMSETNSVSGVDIFSPGL